MAYKSPEEVAHQSLAYWNGVLPQLVSDVVGKLPRFMMLDSQFAALEIPLFAGHVLDAICTCDAWNRAFRSEEFDHVACIEELNTTYRFHRYPPRRAIMYRPPDFLYEDCYAHLPSPNEKLEAMLWQLAPADYEESTDNLA